jgi:hypothetical protein
MEMNKKCVNEKSGFLEPETALRKDSIFAKATFKIK